MVNLEDLPHSSTESKGDHPNCSTCIKAGKQLCSTKIRQCCGIVLVHEKKPIKLNGDEENPKKWLQIMLGFNTHQIERTEVSSFGLGRRPERRTISSNYHISKLFNFMEINKLH